MAAGDVFRQLRVRPRLVIAIGLGIALWLLLPGGMPKSTRTIAALDAGGMIFLVLTWIMMGRATHERMRLRARLQDEARVTMLLLTVGAAVFSLSAIADELHGVKELPPAETLAHIGLAAGSIVISWLVTHTLFALHYAHAYYGDADDDPLGVEHAGGMEFPGCDHPDYWDFLYFAYVIGMTCQTSDVQLSDRIMRRYCLAQGLLSFFFNTVILALSINIAAGLL